jgi:hypothetical protein
MSPEERLERMAELREQNAESEARIGERERARLQDPVRMQDHILATDTTLTKHTGDLCFTEPLESPYARKTRGNGMLYRRGPENGMLTAPQSVSVSSSETEADYSGWERWMAAHLAAERDVIARAMGDVVLATRRELRQERDAALLARDRQISILQGELADAKRLLTDALTRFSKLEADLKAETNMRDALVNALELQFVELRGRVSGVLRDYIS